MLGIFHEVSCSASSQFNIQKELRVSPLHNVYQLFISICTIDAIQSLLFERGYWRTKSTDVRNKLKNEVD